MGKVFSKRIVKPIVRLLVLVARAIQQVDLIVRESLFQEVILRYLFDVLDMILFLKVLLHKVFVLEGLVVETLRKVFPEVLLVLIDVRAALVFQEFEFSFELLKKRLNVFALQNLAFFEVLLMNTFPELLVPVEPKWVEQMARKLIHGLLILGELLKFDV